VKKAVDIHWPSPAILDLHPAVVPSFKFEWVKLALPEKPEGKRKRWGQGREPNRRPAPATDGRVPPTGPGP